MQYLKSEDVALLHATVVLPTPSHTLALLQKWNHQCLCLLLGAMTCQIRQGPSAHQEQRLLQHLNGAFAQEKEWKKGKRMKKEEERQSCWHFSSPPFHQNAWCRTSTHQKEPHATAHQNEEGNAHFHVQNYAFYQDTSLETLTFAIASSASCVVVRTTPPTTTTMSTDKKSKETKTLFRVSPCRVIPTSSISTAVPSLSFSGSPLQAWQTNAPTHHTSSSTSTAAAFFLGNVEESLTSPKRKRKRRASEVVSLSCERKAPRAISADQRHGRALHPLQDGSDSLAPGRAFTWDSPPPSSFPEKAPTGITTLPLHSKTRSTTPLCHHTSPLSFLSSVSSARTEAAAIRVRGHPGETYTPQPHDPHSPPPPYFQHAFQQLWRVLLHTIVVVAGVVEVDLYVVQEADSATPFFTPTASSKTTPHLEERRGVKEEEEDQHKVHPHAHEQHDTAAPPPLSPPSSSRRRISLLRRRYYPPTSGRPRSTSSSLSSLTSTQGERSDTSVPSPPPGGGGGWHSNGGLEDAEAEITRDSTTCWEACEALWWSLVSVRASTSSSSSIVLPISFYVRSTLHDLFLPLPVRRQPFVLPSRSHQHQEKEEVVTTSTTTAHSPRSSSSYHRFALLREGERRRIHLWSVRQAIQVTLATLWYHFLHSSDALSSSTSSSSSSLSWRTSSTAKQVPSFSWHGLPPSSTSRQKEREDLVVGSRKDVGYPKRITETERAHHHHHHHAPSAFFSFYPSADAFTCRLAIHPFSSPFEHPPTSSSRWLLQDLAVRCTGEVLLTLFPSWLPLSSPLLREVLLLASSSCQPSSPVTAASPSSVGPPKDPLDGQRHLLSSAASAMLAAVYVTSDPPSPPHVEVDQKNAFNVEENTPSPHPERKGKVETAKTKGHGERESEWKSASRKRSLPSPPPPPLTSAPQLLILFWKPQYLHRRMGGHAGPDSKYRQLRQSFFSVEEVTGEEAAGDETDPVWWTSAFWKQKSQERGTRKDVTSTKKKKDAKEEKIKIGKEKERRCRPRRNGRDDPVEEEDFFHWLWGSSPPHTPLLRHSFSFPFSTHHSEKNYHGKQKNHTAQARTAHKEKNTRVSPPRDSQTICPPLSPFPPSSWRRATTATDAPKNTLHKDEKTKEKIKKEEEEEEERTPLHRLPLLQLFAQGIARQEVEGSGMCAEAQVLLPCPHPKILQKATKRSEDPHAYPPSHQMQRWKRARMEAEQAPVRGSGRGKGSRGRRSTREREEENRSTAALFCGGPLAGGRVCTSTWRHALPLSSSAPPLAPMLISLCPSTTFQPPPTASSPSYSPPFVRRERSYPNGVASPLLSTSCESTPIPLPLLPLSHPYYRWIRHAAEKTGVFPLAVVMTPDLLSFSSSSFAPDISWTSSAFASFVLESFSRETPSSLDPTTTTTSSSSCTRVGVPFPGYRSLRRGRHTAPPSPSSACAASSYRKEKEERAPRCSPPRPPSSPLENKAPPTSNRLDALQKGDEKKKEEPKEERPANNPFGSPDWIPMMHLERWKKEMIPTTPSVFLVQGEGDGTQKMIPTKKVVQGRRDTAEVEEDWEEEHEEDAVATPQEMFRRLYAKGLCSFLSDVLSMGSSSGVSTTATAVGPSAKPHVPEHTEKVDEPLPARGETEDVTARKIPTPSVGTPQTGIPVSTSTETGNEARRACSTALPPPPSSSLTFHYASYHLQRSCAPIRPRRMGMAIRTEGPPPSSHSHAMAVSLGAALTRPVIQSSTSPRTRTTFPRAITAEESGAHQGSRTPCSFGNGGSGGGVDFHTTAPTATSWGVASSSPAMMAARPPRTPVLLLHGKVVGTPSSSSSLSVSIPNPSTTTATPSASSSCIPMATMDHAMPYPFTLPLRQCLRVVMDTPQSDPFLYLPTAFYPPIPWKLKACITATTASSGGGTSSTTRRRTAELQWGMDTTPRDPVTSRDEERPDQKEDEEEEEKKIEEQRKTAGVSEEEGGRGRQRKTKPYQTKEERERIGEANTHPPWATPVELPPSPALSSFLHVLQGPPPFFYPEDEEDHHTNLASTPTATTGGGYSCTGTSSFPSLDPPAVIQWNRKFVILVDQSTPQNSSLNPAMPCTQKATQCCRMEVTKGTSEAPQHRKKKKQEDEDGSHALWAHYRHHSSAVSWQLWEDPVEKKPVDLAKGPSYHKDPKVETEKEERGGACGTNRRRNAGDGSDKEKDEVSSAATPFGWSFSSEISAARPFLPRHHRWWVLDPHAIHERLRLEFFLVFVEAYVRHPELPDQMVVGVGAVGEQQVQGDREEAFFTSSSFSSSPSSFFSTPFHHHVPTLLHRLQEIDNVLAQLEEEWVKGRGEGAGKQKGSVSLHGKGHLPSTPLSSSSTISSPSLPHRKANESSRRTYFTPFSYFPIRIPDDLVFRVTTMRKRLWRWGWRFSVDPLTGLAQYILHCPCVCIEGFEFRLEHVEDLRIMLEDLGSFTEEEIQGKGTLPLNTEEIETAEVGMESGQHPKRRRTAAVLIPSSILSFLISRSCRGALMLGDVVTPRMLWEWLKCLVPMQHFHICAHGRPSAAQLIPQSASLLSSF